MIRRAGFRNSSSWCPNSLHGREIHVSLLNAFSDVVHTAPIVHVWWTKPSEVIKHHRVQSRIQIKLNANLLQIPWDRVTSTYEAILSGEEMESVARVNQEGDLKRERLLTRVLMRYSIAAGLSKTYEDRAGIAKVRSCSMMQCSGSRFL